MAQVAAARHALGVASPASLPSAAPAIAAAGEPQSIRCIHDHYELIRKLGSGYTATVYSARCRATGRIVAVKDIDKVMEMCEGRDLVDYVLTRPPGGIATSSCRRLMQQLLLAIHFLHSYNVRILHRDIKLDNIIFRQADSSSSGQQDIGQTGDLALLDFDMCLLLRSEEQQQMQQQQMQQQQMQQQQM
ncbi:CBL-interacting protein kinase 25-like, partial [Cyclospora cayetanensis]|uniref:CBL-interacting protein kinase 25-like n=1 Tax=Cyclospora cayetanensis TaxID=88456 RepID=A0A6P6RTF8_9EIME